LQNFLVTKQGLSLIITFPIRPEDRHLLATKEREGVEGGIRNKNNGFQIIKHQRQRKQRKGLNSFRNKFRVSNAKLSFSLFLLFTWAYYGGSRTGKSYF